MIANVQGLLYTSMDLQVLDAPMFANRRRWAKTQTIPRGGYILAVGELGMFLKSEVRVPEVPDPVGVTTFVTFRRPIGGIKFNVSVCWRRFRPFPARIRRASLWRSPRTELECDPLSRSPDA